MKDVDYGKTIKRSWEVTWKNRWLWVLGLVLAGLGASGGSSYHGGGSGSSGSSNFNVPSPSPIPTDGGNLQNLQNQTIKVLGVATNALKAWFAGFPIHNWVLLGLLILGCVIFFTVIVWLVVAWAKGSLIAGFEDAEAGKEVNLKTFSPYGWAKMKELIIFQLIFSGLILAIILGLVLIVGVGFLIKLAIPVLGMIWVVLFGIVGVLGFVVAMFIFTMLNMYAERLIVLKNYSAWEAWKKGLSLSKGNFIPTLLMGIINSLIGCASGCVLLIVLLLLLGIPMFLLIAPSFRGGFHFPSIGQIIGVAILVALFSVINLLTRAIFVVFDYGNWNLFFRQIMEKEKDVK
jgi:hypothetical protein